MFHSRDSPRLLVCDTGLYMEQNDIGFITVAICGGYISKYPRHVCSIYIVFFVVVDIYQTKQALDIPLFKINWLWIYGTQVLSISFCNHLYFHLSFEWYPQWPSVLLKFLGSSSQKSILVMDTQSTNLDVNFHNKVGSICVNMLMLLQWLYY